MNRTLLSAMLGITFIAGFAQTSSACGRYEKVGDTWVESELIASMPAPTKTLAVEIGSAEHKRIVEQVGSEAFSIVRPIVNLELMDQPGRFLTKLKGEVVLIETRAAASAATPAQRHVDLAICLDTSGSMEGLIESAKIKLWEIVNDLALAKPTPKLRVALITYGNDGHNSETGWVNIDAPLTDDLDTISQKLFALKTNGGTELVARATRAAAEQLDWWPASAGEEPLKLIVVAGNESADQDTQYKYQDICKATISKGIMINSIYCGNPADNLAPAWKEVSTLADGHFACIDQNNGTIVITTPFDDELTKLSAAINTTYIAYGELGAEGKANQTMQDANAASLNSAVAAQRCATKGGAMYYNGQWDLVDACKDNAVKIEEVKDADLPDNMKKMTLDERKAFVKEMTDQRAGMQTQIGDLNVKRQVFVEAEMKKQATNNDQAFDSVLRKAIRAQAAAKGFTFEEPKTTASTVKVPDC